MNRFRRTPEGGERLPTRADIDNDPVFGIAATEARIARLSAEGARSLAAGVAQFELERDVNSRHDTGPHLNLGQPTS